MNPFRWLYLFIAGQSRWSPCWLGFHRWDMPGGHCEKCGLCDEFFGPHTGQLAVRLLGRNQPDDGAEAAERDRHSLEGNQGPADSERVACMGLHRADCIQMDALSFLDGRRMDSFEAIHASPPCQGYSRMARAVKPSAPRLIELVRLNLERIGLPYVIENVEGAPLRGNLVILCGTMFGVRVRRHRLFELGFNSLVMTPPCQCKNGVVRGRLVGQMLSGKVAPGRTPRFGYTESDRREAIGVPWMTTMEARQAIPPAYTEFIGMQLLKMIRGESSM